MDGPLAQGNMYESWARPGLECKARRRPGRRRSPQLCAHRGAYAREVGGRGGGGGRGARIGRVVYSTVDLERFAAAASARRGGRPREKRAVTTGRFSPEKRHEAAVRIMRTAGGGWNAVGNARERPDLDCLEGLRNMVGPGMRFHVNAAEAELDALLGGARACLHPRPESFGIAVVEAIAAGCVLVVPDNSVHPETVPLAGLRYRTGAEAAEIMRGALGGRFDGLLPALREHAQKFSEEAFQEAMVGIIKKSRNREGA